MNIQTTLHHQPYIATPSSAISSLISITPHNYHPTLYYSLPNTMFSHILDQSMTFLDLFIIFVLSSITWLIYQMNASRADTSRFSGRVVYDRDLIRILKSGMREIIEEVREWE